MSGVAGLPARGEIGMAPTLAHGTRFRAPDLGSVLGDRAIARELAGSGHVEDRLAGPRWRVGVEREQARVRLEVRPEVGEVHVVIAVAEQRVAQGGEHPGLVAAEVIREDQIERGARLAIVLVVPLRAVPASALRDL